MIEEITSGDSYRKCCDWLSFLGVTGAVWIINMANSRVFFSLSEILHGGLQSAWNLVLLCSGKWQDVPKWYMKQIK